MYLYIATYETTLTGTFTYAEYMLSYTYVRTSECFTMLRRKLFCI